MLPRLSSLLTIRMFAILLLHNYNRLYMSIADAARKTDPMLAEHAKQLLASPFFGGTDASLYEKQLIFYVLARIKPVSEVDSYHMEWLSPTYGESRSDDQADVAAFLESMKLHYAFKSPYDGTVTVSLRPELLDALQAIDLHGDEATVYRRYGELYGYPKTAVEAAVAEWVHGRPWLLSNTEQDRVEEESGLPHEAFCFRLSKAHWRKELATVRQWYEVLVAYGMGEPNRPSRRP